MNKPAVFSNVLIAEDQVDLLLSYRNFLEMHNYQVDVSSDGQECLEIYLEQIKRHSNDRYSYTEQIKTPYDVVILDYKMPKMDGLEVAEEILKVNPHQRIIFASAYAEGTLKDSIKNLGHIIEIIEKPFELVKLVSMIEDEMVFADLQKLNVNIRNLKGIEPSHEQVKIYLKALNMLHKAISFSK